MADEELRSDVVVVGLGLVGSGAVRHLAVDGVDVIGVGPTEPADWAEHPGVFASHYDSGRITRKLDRRCEWARLAVRAIEQYPVIAEQGGIEFHTPSGTVFASDEADRIADLDEVGRRVGAQHRVLDAAALPSTTDGRLLVADGRLAVPAGSGVIDEPGPAGFVDPRRMLRAQHAAAGRAGARLLREEAVAVEPDGTGDGWRVATASGAVVRAPKVLLATGAHTDEVGPAAGFVGHVRPEAVVLATLDADEADRLAGIPSVLATLAGTRFLDLYQVPPTSYPDGTVKLKLGATLRDWTPLDAGGRRAWMRSDLHTLLLDELRGLVEDLVPGVRATSWATKPCLITDTPSGLPTVDHLAPGLVVAAGGNGYAAKSADAIGALAAGLLTAGEWIDEDLAEAAFRLGAPA